MTTTAAEKVAGISDVLEEILIRLPAKSLARSMLVSKQWLSQISNPQFLQLHFGHRPNKLPTGMFLTNYKSLCSDANFVSFNDLNPIHQTIPSLGFLYEGIKQLVGDGFSDIKLVNSCNGLLLCRVVTLKDLKPPCHRKYCVCNPTTKKFRLLPERPFCASSIVLAFDPSMSLHFKVICTKYFDKRDNTHEIYLYSSENQCWSTYASPFDPRGEWFYLNGSMYCPESSLRFDVYTEKMEQITMPPPRVGYSVWYYLPVIGSHVYRAVRKDPFTTDDLRLVEMSSDFSEWVLKYHVSVPPLLSAFPEINKTSQIFKLYRFKAICVVEGVKEDESDLVLGIPGKLILYNLNKKMGKELCKLHDEPNDIPGYWTAQVYQFIECLFAI